MNIQQNPYKSRLGGQLDAELHSRVSLLVIGCGGAVGAVEDAVASGIETVIAIDPDRASEENVATGRLACDEVGRSKVLIVQSRALKVNPCAEVITYAVHDDQLSAAQTDFIWKKADIAWSMTDDIRVQERHNRLALHYGKPVIFGGIAHDSSRFEVGATLPGRGFCFGCNPGVMERWQRAADRTTPPRSMPSSRLISNRINDAIVTVTLGLLHHWAGSDLPIARYGEEFEKAPLFLGPIDLAYQAGEGQAFGHVPAHDRLFGGRLALPGRPKGWVCPHCKAIH
jgi:hypothetical protein